MMPLLYSINNNNFIYSAIVDRKGNCNGKKYNKSLWHSINLFKVSKYAITLKCFRSLCKRCNCIMQILANTLKKK